MKRRLAWSVVTAAVVLFIGVIAWLCMQFEGAWKLMVLVAGMFTALMVICCALGWAIVELAGNRK